MRKYHTNTNYALIELHGL